MFTADMHCDSIDLLLQGKDSFLTPYNMNEEHLQFLAMFTDLPGRTPEGCWEVLCAMRRGLARQLQQRGDTFALCRTASQVRCARAAGKKALIFSMEGACALDGRAERLEAVAAEGLRCLSLTWNQNNRYGCANTCSGTPEDTGLTAEGAALVRECSRRHILLDISHASDKTAQDILETSTLPVLATHSNYRTVCPHRRNLTDELARGVRDSGGVIGFNLYMPFLGGAAAEALLPQLDYALELVGEDAVAFGCDIDGVDAYPAGLSLEKSIHAQLLEMLSRHGYPEKLLEKLAFGNIMRVLDAVCP